jgi:hypothetical protein
MKGRARSPTISFTNFGGAGTNRALFPDFSVERGLKNCEP